VTVGVIVLAAGLSSRMGGNKLLADLNGRPVLAHVLAAIDAAGLPSLIVLGRDAEAVRQVAGDRKTVQAVDYEEGLSRSLRAGVAAAPAEWQAAIICLGDMPRVPAEVLRALAARGSRSAIVAPACVTGGLSE
jgi:molybdenum cofactor cytidylyltransferase